MLALCYKCGSQKNGALKLCSQCHSVPKTSDDQILSLCLSLECVTQQTLNKCREHFEKKNKAPKFKEPIVKRASEFLEEQMENVMGEQSIEFSASAMNFPDLENEDSAVFKKTVTVHVIGKGPRQDSADANASLGKTKKTYHRVQWEVGKDISEDMYESNKDLHGDIFVWYRWLNNKWAWQCVAPSRFDQLKAVESGHL